MIPILLLLIAIYLVVAPIVEEPQMEFLYAAVFVVGGLVFYFPLVHFKLLSIGKYRLKLYFTMITNYDTCKLSNTPLTETDGGISVIFVWGET